MRVDVKITGLRQAVARAEAETIFRRPLRKALRGMGKLVKANVVATARPISRKLARRVRVKVDRARVPAYVRITNGASWVHVAEEGRRPGAKQPPVTALRGGFAAAKAVAERGLPGHHFMARARSASEPGIAQLVRQLERTMDAIWRGRGR